MNGKDYVIDAIKRTERVMSDIKSLDALQGEPLVIGTVKACGDLSNLKNRATLRTRNGAHLAYPVFEAAQNLEEAWDEAGVGDDLGELKERMEEFMNAADALSGALKERTVIMT